MDGCGEAVGFPPEGLAPAGPSTPSAAPACRQVAGTVISCRGKAFKTAHRSSACWSCHTLLHERHKSRAIACHDGESLLLCQVRLKPYKGWDVWWLSTPQVSAQHSAARGPVRHGPYKHSPALRAAVV